jgi:transposase InsO family protein
MKYGFIESHASTLTVDALCKTLGVARSGYYRWRKAGLGQREVEDQVLAGELIESFHKNRDVYGSRRLRDDLQALGRRHGRRRIRRLMSASGLNVGKTRRFVTTTKRDLSKRPAPNVLNREFVAHEPNRKWVSDITHIPTDEGDLYLAVTLDLWSRRVVGWAMRDTLHEELVHAAFDMAVLQRAPQARLLHHADQGAQYTATRFRGKLQHTGVIESNSRTANVWDNSVAESFFATLEKEVLAKTRFRTRAEARGVIFEYIEVFYNRQRAHSTLGGLSPANFEQAQRN